jgi:hypothetical protein
MGFQTNLSTLSLFIKLGTDRTENRFPISFSIGATMPVAAIT